jgi:hypothetical protein
LYLHIPVITGLWINMLIFCILHPIGYWYISHYQLTLIIYFKPLFLWLLFYVWEMVLIPLYFYFILFMCPSFVFYLPKDGCVAGQNV